MSMPDNTRRWFTSQLEEQFRRLYTDKESFLDELKPALSGIWKDQFADGRINGLRHLWAFDGVVLDGMYFMAYGHLDGNVTIKWWECLRRNEIVKRQFRRGLMETSEYYLDANLLARHINDKTFANLFEPTSWLHERYGAMTVAIDVRTSSGDQSRGSGFLVGRVFPLTGPSQPRRRFLVTCRHNIEVSEILGATTADGVGLALGASYLSDSHDVAIFAVDAVTSDHPIALGSDAAVFDETFTIGFPFVPGCEEAVMVGHKGEVNGYIDHFMQRERLMLMSNLVSPGSSGCPVLDRAGRCVGMTVNWLENEYLKPDPAAPPERARFSAAIPVSTICSEIERAGWNWWTPSET